MKYLILGVNGMLGHVLFNEASRYGEVRGTTRRSSSKKNGIYSAVSTDNLVAIEKILSEYRPDIVINCIGVIKQLKESNDAVTSIKVNSLFPHQLAHLTAHSGSRLIHLSTDCIFSGNVGNYADGAPSDAEDIYGKTKYLGELPYSHCLTLRTSIIGHELESNVSLVDWFLTQNKTCHGYQKAVYSGFPTISLANIIFNLIGPKFNNGGLGGVFNLSSDPISKFDLLSLIAETYKKKISILADDKVRIDRSLDSSKLRELLSFKPLNWSEMITEMHRHFLENGYLNLNKEYKL